MTLVKAPKKLIQFDPKTFLSTVNGGILNDPIRSMPLVPPARFARVASAVGKTIARASLPNRIPFCTATAD